VQLREFARWKSFRSNTGLACQAWKIIVGTNQWLRHLKQIKKVQLFVVRVKCHFGHSFSLAFWQINACVNLVAVLQANGDFGGAIFDTNNASFLLCLPHCRSYGPSTNRVLALVISRNVRF
jgi:hypothetical protein